MADAFMVSIGKGDLVRFVYRNYRGQVQEREVEFHSLRFGCNEYYPEPTWFLHGLDVVRGVERSFAFSNIEGGLMGLAYGCGSCRQSVGHSSTCAFKPQNLVQYTCQDCGGGIDYPTARECPHCGIKFSISPPRTA